MSNPLTMHLNSSCYLEGASGKQGLCPKQGSWWAVELGAAKTTVTSWAWAVQWELGSVGTVALVPSLL